MKDGDYIGLHTKVIYWLPRNRKYTEIEALISHTLDINNGSSYSINGYAKLWQWSRTKVRNFIDNINSEKGHHKDIHQDNDRTSLGQGVIIKINNFQPKEDKDSTETGHLEDRPLDTTIKNKKKKKEKPPVKEVVYSEEFLSFWKVYPRRKSKGHAWKAWIASGIDNGMVEEVMVSVIAFAKTQVDKEEKFIPHPATWLNGRRWEDEIDEVKKPEPFDMFEEMNKR